MSGQLAGNGMTAARATSGDPSPVDAESTAFTENRRSTIDHTHGLVSDIGSLCLSERFSDVVLKVNGERFHAHRVILASRSNYFRALLYGGFKESNQSEVEISKISVNAFKHLLEYIYSGRMNLKVLKDDIILEIFNLSNLYGFTNLGLALSKFLRTNMKFYNVCSMFVGVRYSEYKELVTEVLDFIDNHALEVLHSESFLTLSPEDLQDILNRDTLYAYEISIFQAVCRWIKANQDDKDTESKMKVLSVVRYPLMTLNELLTIVRESQLVSSDDILNAIHLKNSLPSYELKFRGKLRPNLNIAHPSQGTEIIQGVFFKSGSNLYYHEPGSTRNDSSVIIKLSDTFIINYIEMELTDKNLRSFSYYIEVSMDMDDWIRVIDYSNYHGHSTQRLWIHLQPVRFIRIMCTNNIISKFFRVISLKVMYNSKEMDLIEIEEGLVSPKYNVATLSLNTIVTNGYGVHDSSLVDGNYQDYNLYTGYTCHELDHGYILVQLGQPYMLRSMRMLLWDCDDRFYSYRIEVSANMYDWELVIDKSKERVRSWQLIKFNPRPVVFIRITGTYNSANNAFHCVHFETPAQVLSDPIITEIE